MTTTEIQVPHLRYSCSKSVDVNKGLSQNWRRTFKLDDVRVPEGWVHALEINNRMYSFSFCSIQHSKKCADGQYIMVIDNFSREQALGREAKTEKRYYLMPVMSVLRPTQEEGAAALQVNEFLKENAACTFTESCIEAARRAKTIRIN